MTPTEAIIELGQAGKNSFIVGHSDGSVGFYQVEAKFKTLEEMQAFYRAIVNCGQVFQELEAELEAERQAYPPPPDPIHCQMGHRSGSAP